MFSRPKWKVSYLVQFGAWTIHEEDEYYYAWTKFGAWLAFRLHYGKNLPNSYQCNYTYDVMKDDITKCP